MLMRKPNVFRGTLLSKTLDESASYLVRELCCCTPPLQACVDDLGEVVHGGCIRVMPFFRRLCHGLWLWLFWVASSFGFGFGFSSKSKSKRNQH
mmetsp:Transcript_62020/g.130975  ORF Transcript_62020/g.130975 Transcript_62020/m.130975 type:complete len:94 (+) Transcript_62020:971-1252(+)